jgi:hypothetical protein
MPDGGAIVEDRTEHTDPATVPGDRAGFRLAAFGAVLIVVLFAGYGLGRLNESTPSPAPTAMPGMAVDESQPHSHSGGGTTTPMGATVGGLSLSESGLTLVPAETTFTAGRAQRLSFRVTGPGGAPVTTYAIVHDKPLHLIVVRRDLGDFQHLHPAMAADGTWSIDLTLAEPGVYRMIADFTATVGGRQIAATLGSDLTVAGEYAPDALPAPARTAEAGGFTVAYEGTPITTATQPILVTVTGPDGKPAVLEPYLAAYGHLVVLRRGDLAYVHVHPEPALADGKVKFWLTLPSAGAYRMFFDFQVAGAVHTAAWSATVG